MFPLNALFIRSQNELISYQPWYGDKVILSCKTFEFLGPLCQYDFVFVTISFETPKGCIANAQMCSFIIPACLAVTIQSKNSECVLPKAMIKVGETNK